jgi:uncharacterized protein
MTELPTDLPGWRTKLAALAAAHAGTDGAHDANHLDRVWRNAQALLPHHPEADPLVVLAACYLHDLVNLPQPTFSSLRFRSFYPEFLFSSP